MVRGLSRNVGIVMLCWFVGFCDVMNWFTGLTASSNLYLLPMILLLVLSHLVSIVVSVGVGYYFVFHHDYTSLVGEGREHCLTEVQRDYRKFLDRNVWGIDRSATRPPPSQLLSHNSTAGSMPVLNRNYENNNQESVGLSTNQQPRSQQWNGLELLAGLYQDSHYERVLKLLINRLW